MRTTTILLCALMLFHTRLNAEMTVKNYRLLKSSVNESVVFNAKTFISGLGNGIDWANVELITQKKRPLFCPPEALSLTVDNYMQIIDDEIQYQSKLRTESELENVSVGFLLMQGLKKTFPCGKSK